jgi:hypothetical protein
LEEQAEALADAIDALLPDWVERCVRDRLNPPVPDDVLAAARSAGEQARAEVGVAVRRLLEADVDEQRGNPLDLLRRAVRYPTEVLRAAGAPAVDRDDFSRSRFPDDDYDLTPATWADVDPSLADLGIAWGAAKAFVHRQRHMRT